jgi:hypothetical protein
MLPAMQKFITLICAILFLALTAFKPSSGLEDVISALRSGNATELSKHIDENIEISIPDKTDSYSRAQALMVLQDFFSTNEVNGFEVKHKGENGGNQFCIGILKTKKGNFRTTIFMKTRNGKSIVREIQFQS